MGNSIDEPLPFDDILDINYYELEPGQTFRIGNCELTLYTQAQKFALNQLLNFDRFISSEGEQFKQKILHANNKERMLVLKNIGYKVSFGHMMIFHKDTKTGISGGNMVEANCFANIKTEEFQNFDWLIKTALDGAEIRILSGT